MLDPISGQRLPAPTEGDRVVHDETGKEGVITLTPANTATRVMVRFDGADFEVPVHPGSLKYLDQAA